MTVFSNLCRYSSKVSPMIYNISSNVGTSAAILGSGNVVHCSKIFSKYRFSLLQATQSANLSSSGQNNATSSRTAQSIHTNVKPSEDNKTGATNEYYNDTRDEDFLKFPQMFANSHKAEEKTKSLMEVSEDQNNQGNQLHKLVKS